MFRRLLAVSGLSGLVVAQPVLDLFGRSPATFEFHRIDGRSIVLFAVGVVMIPPLVLWVAGEVVHAVNQSAGKAVHLGTVAVLLAGFGTLIAKSLTDVTGINLIFGLAIGAGGAWAYHKYEPIGMWVRLVAAANLLFLFQFTFVAPVADWIESASRSAEPSVAEPIVTAPPARAADDGTAADEPADPPSVFVFVFDEFPTLSILAEDATIDPVRFPNLSTFAADATWYRRHTTVSPFTHSALPSILTGQNPQGGPTWTDHPDSAFSLLAGSHHLVVSEVLTRMCGFDTCGSQPIPPPPPARDTDEPSAAPVPETTPAPATVAPSIDTGPRWGDLLGLTWDVWKQRVGPSRRNTPAAFDDFREELVPRVQTPSSPEPRGPDPRRPDPRRPDPPDDTVDSIPAPVTTAPVADTLTEEQLRLELFFSMLAGSQPGRLQLFLDALRPTDRPLFGYLHLVLPHQPWTLREDGTFYEVLGVRKDFEGDNSDPWPIQVSRQKHLLQAEYTDRLIGLMLAHLQSIDEYDNSLIIVVSDHGVVFEPGQLSRSLAGENLAEIAYTPLFIKAPGQTSGRVDDQNFNSTDIMPTVADILGVVLPWEADGFAAGSPEIAARGGRKQIYEYTEATGDTYRGIEEFDDDEAFATMLTRRFPSVTAEEDRIAGLYRDLPGRDLIGADPDDAFGVGAGTARIEGLDRLREPGDSPKLGEVAGRVVNPPVDAVAVVAVNDRVVGLSRLYRRDGADGSFVVLLPGDALTDATNEIRLALRRADGTVEELDVEG